ncbi:hypothetical protein NLI96_g4522 [Meripilus lineatus]|uniref:Phospho-2-dehydro-3-deoxyheptonate aldolase n=1 Tax=Meripilus lineatus TaxID=2056292 RepID=A0AAD5V9R5_9APHY|nr:hypothetical protein NLI96_g4522 [Physisporinus lineatus]
MSSKSWTPSSWRDHPAAQDVEYPDRNHLSRVLEKIHALPPLVTPSEIERLRHQLSLVQKNEAFLLHAGDCAESFEACTHDNISAKIGLILSFSLILIWGARLPIVGLLDGTSFQAPVSRSIALFTCNSPTEKVGDKQVLSFRGDNVNGLDPNDRTPDPERLLSLLSSGFASLSHPRAWSLSHVRSPALRKEFERISEGLSDALGFTRTIGYGRESVSYEQGGGKSALGEVDFYTRNPIGIKVGPSMASHELVELLDIVNPDKVNGKVTLITRYGAAKIENFLRGHILEVQKSGHPVIWICDPMHGNTLTSSNGLKTRNFGTIISELTSCIRIHSETGSRLGGISLEFTGELTDDGFSVTECLGGSMELSEEQLELRYQSFCDPRLNFEQSLDVAFLISNHFKKERLGHTRSDNDVLYAELGGRSPA